MVSDSSDTVTKLTDEGTDTVISRVSFTLSDHLESLVLTGSYAIDGIGNGLADALTGNSNANKLSGGAGDDLLDGAGGHDRLYGGYGRDTLNGGSGNDTLFGGKDADTLVGGEGSDWIEGGAGADSSSGGSGADRFVFRQGDFSGATLADVERITDFNSGEGDLIDLSFLDADGGQNGDQAFTFIGREAFSGTAGQLRFQQVDGNTYLQFDTDGDGTANFVLRLDGLLSLGGRDFIL